LSQTIDSVLAQSFSDFQLIIIDDNSPDDTETVVARYNDSRIRYLRNPSNLGPEGTWNLCLEEARGRYFKLLPQDDILYPNSLERQIEVLESDKHERIALVFGSRNIIDGNGRILIRRGYRYGLGVVPGLDVIRRCVRNGTNLIGEPGNVLLRKSLADKIGKFTEKIPYVIDLDYWVRLLTHGDGFYLSDPISAFRVSSGSWSVAIGARQTEDFRRFIYKLSQQPGLGLSSTDIKVGNLKARWNTFMRLFFYHFVIK